MLVYTYVTYICEGNKLHNSPKIHTEIFHFEFKIYIFFFYWTAQINNKKKILVYIFLCTYTLEWNVVEWILLKHNMISFARAEHCVSGRSGESGRIYPIRFFVLALSSKSFMYVVGVSVLVSWEPFTTNKKENLWKLVLWA